MPTSKNKVMFGVPSFISSQSQQLGQNLNLGQEYTPETAAKMQALERKQQIANILLQQGMMPKEARQAGRFVVAPSMWEQASGPLTTALGALSSMYLDDQRSAIASDEAKRVAAAYQAYNEGTSDVPEFKGRTVLGTGVQGVEAQPAVEAAPSNLESIIAAEQLHSRPNVMRKSMEDITNAMAQRQTPPMLRSNPQWDVTAPIPTPYRPAVETKAAVPGVVGKPDRRETPYEALEREFGAQAAQDFVNNGFAPGTTPETAARMERVVKDAERPDAPGRPRTPGELMAADTALLASGAPGAWPLIQLTKQQREADLARKENREDRQAELNVRLRQEDLNNEIRLMGLQEKAEYHQERMNNERLSINQRELAAKEHDATLIAIAKLNNAGKREKDADKEALRLQSREDAVGLINEMRENFRRLNEGGGVSSTANSSLTNMGAAIGSSAFGQTFGRMVGTDNQSLRNSINNARPVLVALLAKSLSMSAQQINSNAELKLWLDAATDPSKDLQANYAALDRLEKLIGTHGGPTNPNTPKAGMPSEVGGGVDTSGWTYMTDKYGKHALVSPDKQFYQMVP